MSIAKPKATKPKTDKAKKPKAATESKMAMAQKREWAYQLYTRDNLTQKEIALKVGVAEKTVGEWKAKDKWDDIKTSLTITKQAEIKRLYAQLTSLNDSISQREQGKRYPDSKEADTIGKLASAIKSLETETSLADTISVGIDFTEWLRKFDLPKAQEMTSLFDSYIETLLSR